MSRLETCNEQCTDTRHSGSCRGKQQRARNKGQKDRAHATKPRAHANQETVRKENTVRTPIDTPAPCARAVDSAPLLHKAVVPGPLDLDNIKHSLPSSALTLDQVLMGALRFKLATRDSKGYSINGVSFTRAELEAGWAKQGWTCKRLGEQVKQAEAGHSVQVKVTA